MNTLLKTAVLCMAVGVALPAQAQLASYVDDRGNLVYTNNESQHPRKSPFEKASATSDPKNSQPSAAGSTTGGQRLGADVLHQLVQETAQKHNVDPTLISAVLSPESNWNTSAISRKGAQGLMQLVPETAQHFGVFNAFDPAQNVDAGTRQ